MCGRPDNPWRHPQGALCVGFGVTDLGSRTDIHVPGEMVDCGSCSYLSAFHCEKIVFQGLLDFSLPIATSM